MLIAVEYLGNVGVGVTAPQFFRGNDGKIYIVKLQNNRLGRKILVNELLAAKFGEIMGLCFPFSSIIEINEQTLQKNSNPTESGMILGKHFASQYLDCAQYAGKHNINIATNKTAMAGVLLFDHMFHNADRANNHKNLLVRQEDCDYKIYAIDNSHLFRSGNWTLESLNKLAAKIKIYHRYSFGLLLKEYLSPQDFRPYVDKIVKLCNESIEELVLEIPNEWLPNELERQALMNYIKIRRDIVEEIWKKLCKYMPQSRGGYSYLL